MTAVLGKWNGAPAYLNILHSLVAVPMPTRETKILRSQQNSTWVRRAFDVNAITILNTINVKVSNTRYCLMKEIHIDLVVEDSRAPGDEIDCDRPGYMPEEAAQV